MSTRNQGLVLSGRAVVMTTSILGQFKVVLALKTTTILPPPPLLLLYTTSHYPLLYNTSFLPSTLYYPPYSLLYTVLWKHLTTEMPKKKAETPQK